MINHVHAGLSGYRLILNCSFRHLLIWCQWSIPRQRLHCLHRESFLFRSGWFLEHHLLLDYLPDLYLSLPTSNNFNLYSFLSYLVYISLSLQGIGLLGVSLSVHVSCIFLGYDHLGLRLFHLFSLRAHWATILLTLNENVQSFLGLSLDAASFCRNRDNLW